MGMEEEEEMWEPNDEEKQWMFEGNLAFLMLSGGAFVHALMDVTSWKWALIAEGLDADGETEDQYSIFGNEYDLIAAGEDVTPLWRRLPCFWTTPCSPLWVPLSLLRLSPWLAL